MDDQIPRHRACQLDAMVGLDRRQCEVDADEVIRALGLREPGRT